MATTYTLQSTEISMQDFLKHYEMYEQFNDNATIAHLFIPETCRITVYKSGKILIQGKGAELEYNKWQSIKQEVTPKQSDEPLTAYIGCDETGVGDYFAPLVAAACYVDKSIIAQLQEFNIKDSKQLTDDYIVEIAPLIKTIVPHTIFTLSNERYNNLIDNGYNSHAIKAFVHNTAIEKLINKSNLPLSIDIVMDQFASPKNYRNYLKDIPLVFMPTVFETKAENKYIGVACASILARYQFLQTVKRNSDKYDKLFPLGAGSKVDAFGKEFISLFGEDEFKKNVKWHFANTDKIMN